MTVTVLPEELHVCHYDVAELAGLAQGVLDAVGLDRDLRIEVDEMNPLAWVTVAACGPGIDPIVLQVAGGAFEDQRKPRNLSVAATNDTLARILFRLHDRLDPAFGDPPPEGSVPIPELNLWETWAVGRAMALGLAGQEARYRYVFRNRHGFTDAADAAFDRLWAGGATWTWPKLVALGAELAGARSAAV